MLNSMNLTANGHYPLKIKTMFDLAIASSQRYSLSPSHQPPHQQQQHIPLHRHNSQINYSGSHVHQQHQHHHHSQYNSPEVSHPHLQNPKLECHINDNNNSGGIVTMEECSLGNGNGGMYPRSPQSESSPKSNDSSGSRSPIGNGEGRASPPAAYRNNNNLTPPGSLTSAEGGGKSTGRNKQGVGTTSSSGEKPSFSIESLLAHSSGWRRQQNNNCTEAGGTKGVNMKDNRFSPYHITPPQQQPTQPVKRSSDNSGAIKSSSSAPCPQSDNNEKRTENFGGTSKSGGASGANTRRATKSKRVRTIFTPEQLERLEAEFERQQYMVGPERLYLASSLYLTEAQVKVWFQNRRIKWRKQHLEMEQQRLAIYRTLAEQDMMASAGDDEDLDEPEEDSADCDYDMDDSDPIAHGDGDQRSSTTHFPVPQHNRSKANHSFPLNCSSASPHPPTTAPPIHHIGLPKPPKSLPNLHPKSERTRLPLQQTPSNEDYDASSSTTHSSGSPPSFGGIPSASKGDDYCNNLQGVKN